MNEKQMDYAQIGAAPKAPEYIEIAKKIAEQVMEFSQFEQNNLLKAIYSIVREKRVCDYEETQKRADYLKKSLEEL